MKDKNELELTSEIISLYEKSDELLNSFSQKIAITDYNKNHLKITDKDKWINNLDVSFYIIKNERINVVYNDFFDYLGEVIVPFTAFLNEKTIEDYCLNTL